MSGCIYLWLSNQSSSACMFWNEPIRLSKIRHCNKIVRTLNFNFLHEHNQLLTAKHFCLTTVINCNLQNRRNINKISLLANQDVFYGHHLNARRYFTCNVSVEWSKQNRIDVALMNDKITRLAAQKLWWIQFDRNNW